MAALRFHPEAINDVDQSILRYEAQQPGVGDRFDAKIKAAYAKIQRHPRAWPIRKKDARHYKVDRFPYNVIYVERPNAIWIVAVAHEKRHPNFWTKRLKDIP